MNRRLFLTVAAVLFSSLEGRADYFTQVLNDAIEHAAYTPFHYGAFYEGLPVDAPYSIGENVYPGFVSDFTGYSLSYRIATIESLGSSQFYADSSSCDAASWNAVAYFDAFKSTRADLSSLDYMRYASPGAYLEALHGASLMLDAYRMVKPVYTLDGMIFDNYLKSIIYVNNGRYYPQYAYHLDGYYPIYSYNPLYSSQYTLNGPANFVYYPTPYSNIDFYVYYPNGNMLQGTSVLCSVTEITGMPVFGSPQLIDYVHNVDAESSRLHLPSFAEGDVKISGTQYWRWAIESDEPTESHYSSFSDVSWTDYASLLVAAEAQVSTYWTSSGFSSPAPSITPPTWNVESHSSSDCVGLYNGERLYAVITKLDFATDATVLPDSGAPGEASQCLIGGKLYDFYPNPEHPLNFDSWETPRTLQIYEFVRSKITGADSRIFKADGGVEVERVGFDFLRPSSCARGNVSLDDIGVRMDPDANMIYVDLGDGALVGTQLQVQANWAGRPIYSEGVSFRSAGEGEPLTATVNGFSIVVRDLGGTGDLRQRASTQWKLAVVNNAGAELKAFTFDWTGASGVVSDGPRSWTIDFGAIASGPDVGYTVVESVGGSAVRTIEKQGGLVVKIGSQTVFDGWRASDNAAASLTLNDYPVTAELGRSFSGIPMGSTYDEVRMGRVENLTASGYDTSSDSTFGTSSTHVNMSAGGWVYDDKVGTTVFAHRETLFSGSGMNGTRRVPGDGRSYRSYQWVRTNVKTASNALPESSYLEASTGEDGLAVVREYFPDSRREVAASGIPDNASAPTAVTDGTRTETTYTTLGFFAGSETRDIRTSALLARTQVMASDTLGRPTTLRDEHGWESSYTYDTLGRITTATGPDGSTTATVYDALDRPTSVTVTAGTTTVSTTTYAYSGLTTTTTVTSGGITRTSSETVDQLGNLVSASDDFTGATRTTAVSYDSASKTFDSATTLQGRTSHEIRHVSGQLLRVYGDGMHGVGYAYAVANDPVSGAPCILTTVTPEDDNGNPVPAFASKSYTDGLGRLRTEEETVAGKTVRTAYAYDNNNRLSKVATTVGGVAQPATLYGYDALGRLFRVATDVNGNGAIDLAGPDQVTEYAYVTAADKVTTITYAYTGKDSAQRQEISRAEALLGDASGTVKVTPFGRADLAVTTTVDPASRTVLTQDTRNNFSRSVGAANLLGATTTVKGPRGTSTMTAGAEGVFSPVTRGANYGADSFSTSVASTGLNATTTYSTTSGARTVTGTATSTPTAFNDSASDGRSTHATFDAFGRLASRTATDTPSITRSTAAAGADVTSTLTTAANGAATQFKSLGATGAASKTYADGRGPGSVYDPVARTLTTTLADSTHLVMTYDALGAVVSITETGRPAITMTRDRLGRIATLADASGSRAYVYDDLGRLVSDTATSGLFDGDRLRYAYESTGLGRLSGVRLDASGSTLHAASYGYAGDSTLVNDVAGLGFHAAFTHGATGTNISDRPASLQVAIGGAPVASVAFTYDDQGRLIGRETVAASGHVFSRGVTFGTSGTDADRRATASMEGDVRWEYAYGTNGALTAAVLKRKSDPQSSVYDLEVPGGSFAYGADALGNRFGSAARTSNGNITTEAGDAHGLNRPDGITEPGVLEIGGNAVADATIAVYSWPASAAHVRVGDWTSGVADGTTAAFAEYAANLAAGKWRLRLRWPSGNDAGATASVRVTVSTLAGVRAKLVDPHTAVATPLIWDDYVAMTPLVAARVRVSADGASGNVTLPEVVWEKKPADANETPVSVTVDGSAPASVESGGVVTRSGDTFHAALAAPSGAAPGIFARRVLIVCSKTDTVTGKTFSAENGGTLVGVVGAATPSYTPDGHLASDSRRAALEWSPSGRLEAITLYDGRRIVETHDAQGRRVRRVVYTGVGGSSAGETRYEWDGWTLLREVEFDASGAVAHTRRYLWGPDLDGSSGDMGHVGALLGVEYDGAPYATVCDVSGHIVALLDASGAVAAGYEYGPFGEPLRETGPAKDACPFRWNTRYWDADTQLYYFGYRHYDPLAGRWLSREPLGEGAALNLYAYCGGDPVNKFDYLGLEPRSPSVMSPEQIATEISEAPGKRASIISIATMATARYTIKPAGLGYWDSLKWHLSQSSRFDAARKISNQENHDLNNLKWRVEFLTKLGKVHAIIGPDGYGKLRPGQKSNPLGTRIQIIKKIMEVDDAEALDVDERYFAGAISGTGDLHLAVSAAWLTRGAKFNGILLTSIGGGFSGLEGGTEAGMRLGTISRSQIGGRFAAEGEMVIVYRGVHAEHPGLADALNGEARPIGGHANPEWHTQGDTESIFTSWTTDRNVANFRANLSGQGGVILQDSMPVADIIKSQFGQEIMWSEFEVLRIGNIKGATVIPVGPKL